MRVTKRQLKRIIKEEKRKLLKEQRGSQESLSPLVTFGQAWAGMGGAVQEQMVDLVNAHVEGRITDAVYEMNPNALDVAFDRLGNVLNILGQTNPDAEELLDAMDEARSIFEQGEWGPAEVESDAAAAGDRPAPRGGVTESLLREAMGYLPVLGGQLPYEEDSDSSRFAESEIENSIIHTLENNPGIGGMALTQRVMGEVSGADQNSVFSFLDVLLEDGLVSFDDEEDTWYMANDTPHEVDKEWDIL